MNCIFKNMFCHQYPNRARIIILFHPCPFYRQSRTWCIHIGFIRLIIKDWVLSFCFRFKLCTWCYQKCTHIKGAHFVLVSFIFCSWQVAGLGVLIKYKMARRLRVTSPTCGISSWTFYMSHLQFVLLKEWHCWTLWNFAYNLQFVRLTELVLYCPEHAWTICHWT